MRATRTGSRIMDAQSPFRTTLPRPARMTSDPRFLSRQITVLLERPGKYPLIRESNIF
jgi:hypothetical protein